MSNMPSASSAVEAAKSLGTLGIGVHLNLTEGKPLCEHEDMSRLIDSEGHFKSSIARLGLFSLADPRVRNGLRTELAAQIQWLIDQGIQPTHLDSHKHFHTIPHLFSIVCQLARRFGIRAIRYSMEPPAVSAVPWPLPSVGGRQRARLIRAMARLNRLANRDFIKTDALLGISHVGKIDVNFFKAVALYNSAATAEVLTHPGYSEGLNESQTSLVGQRKIELNTLCNEKTRQYLKDSKIELIHYGQA
jgi:predicted glycoside hydrolase/deacetylase ChbG (UPF0249 family)